MSGSHRSNGPRDHGLASVDAGFARSATEPSGYRIVHIDESVFYRSTDLIGPADEFVLDSARDEKGSTGHTFFIELGNQDFAGNADFLTIDGSKLAADTDGDGELQAESVLVSSAFVTNFDMHVTTGAANDAITSGVGSDTIATGAGDDYVSIGLGDDIVRTGSGADFIDVYGGSFDRHDAIDGGKGSDELSLYGPAFADADFRHVSSIEVLGLSGDADLALNGNAQAMGLRSLFVDDAVHHISVGADFTRAVTFNMSGDSSGNTTLDASASRATVTIHNEYGNTNVASTWLGGTGKDDTIYVSSGFQFEGAPRYGGDLTATRHFEHVVVASAGGDAGATVILDTAAADIEAKVQTVDAHALGSIETFDLAAAGARVAIHVIAGAADDMVTTGSGNDRLEGGLGADTLTGGAGKDVFVYTALADSAGSADTIADFTSGKDKVDVTGIGGDQPDLSGAVIRFFGNQDGGSGDDAAFARTADNGRLDAVFRADTHTLWFDTNDDGALDGSDLHVGLTGVAHVGGGDLLNGHTIG